MEGRALLAARISSSRSPDHGLTRIRKWNIRLEIGPARRAQIGKGMWPRRRRWPRCSRPKIEPSRARAAKLAPGCPRPRRRRWQQLAITTGEGGAGCRKSSRRAQARLCQPRLPGHSRTGGYRRLERRRRSRASREATRRASLGMSCAGSTPAWAVPKDARHQRCRAMEDTGDLPHLGAHIANWLASTAWWVRRRRSWRSCDPHMAARVDAPERGRFPAYVPMAPGVNGIALPRPCDLVFQGAGSSRAGIPSGAACPAAGTERRREGFWGLCPRRAARVPPGVVFAKMKRRAPVGGARVNLNGGLRMISLDQARHIGRGARKGPARWAEAPVGGACWTRAGNLFGLSSGRMARARGGSRFARGKAYGRGDAWDARLGSGWGGPRGQGLFHGGRWNGAFGGAGARCRAVVLGVRDGAGGGRGRDRRHLGQ